MRIQYAIIALPCDNYDVIITMTSVHGFISTSKSYITTKPGKMADQHALTLNSR